jgi:hypothetical protein
MRPRPVQFLDHRLGQAAPALDRVRLHGDQSGEIARAGDGAR